METNMKREGVVTEEYLVKSRFIRWAITAFLILVFVMFVFGEGLPAAAPYYGVAAQASVDRLWTGPGLRGGIVYYAGVRYQDGESPRAGSSYVNYAYYSTLFPGQRVPIHYFRFYPSAPSLDASPRPMAHVFYVSSALIFFLLFLNAKVKRRDPPLE